MVFYLTKRIFITYNISFPPIYKIHGGVHRAIDIHLPAAAFFAEFPVSLGFRDCKSGANLVVKLVGCPVEKTPSCAMMIGCTNGIFHKDGSGGIYKPWFSHLPVSDILRGIGKSVNDDPFQRRLPASRG